MFNSVLAKVILEQANGKKSVGIHLSGGKDTRAILAVLMGAGVKVDGVVCIDNEKKHIKEDLQISSLICKEFDLNMVKISGENDFFSLSRKGNHGFDVLFSGFLMTELLDRGFSPKGNVVIEIVEKTRKLLNEVEGLCVPMMDVECLAASSFIPFYFKFSGLVNRKVIEWNYPDLLRFDIHSGFDKK
jgi:hypothetical protein